MTDATPLTDAWVQRLTDSSQRDAALEELRQVLMRGLCRTFSNVPGRYSFCEDTAQEALIRILNKLDSFRGRSQFTTWAMSIAVRIGTSELRRKRFKDVSLDSLRLADNLKFDVIDHSEAHDSGASELCSILEKLRELIADTLTDRQRLAMDALMKGMPVEEIAVRTNSNRNAVYKLVHDARTKLRSGLERAGFSSDTILSTLA